MGLFDSLFGGGEPQAEVEEKIKSSECGQLFANAFRQFFSPGGEQYQWLMANSKERMYRLEVFRNGVKLTQVEVNQFRYRKTGTYDVDSQAWSFGASGYADLPNGQYVNVFRSFLFQEIQANCPAIMITDNTYIKLNESAKKGW